MLGKQKTKKPAASQLLQNGQIEGTVDGRIHTATFGNIISEMKVQNSYRGPKWNSRPFARRVSRGTCHYCRMVTKKPFSDETLRVANQRIVSEKSIYGKRRK